MNCEVGLPQVLGPEKNCILFGNLGVMKCSGPKKTIPIMISGFSLVLGPECEILMFTWSFGPLGIAGSGLWQRAYRTY